MRHIITTLSTALCLALPATAVLAETSALTGPLASALDSTINKLKLGQVRDFHTLWGPQDEPMVAIIAKAPANPFNAASAPTSTSGPSLLEAIAAAKANGAAAPAANPFITPGSAPSAPPANTTPPNGLASGFAAAIQHAKATPAAAKQSCITPLALGNTGGYQDNALCFAASNRDHVRNVVLKQAGWKLSASFNQTDLALSPDGFGVLFFYTPTGELSQVLVLLNGAK